MRIALALLVTVHGLVHLLGFAKAFDLAALDALHLPISRPMGLIWLLSALLILSAAATWFAMPRWFWVVSLVAISLSQFAIVASWEDARFGTLGNVLLLLAGVHGAFAWGPLGLRAEYQRLVQEGFERASSLPRPPVIVEEDLTRLPPPVQRYLRFTGVVGTPRLQGFQARMSGRIRGSATAPWMPFQAEQWNFYDPPRRYFFIEATRSGLSVDGLHAYGEDDATMRIRLLSLFPLVTVAGPQMQRGETVTVLNDACLFAPAALIDLPIQWQQIDDQRVEATFHNAVHQVKAVLVFDDSGALVDFQSDDRPALGPDGKTLIPQRWSTPIRNYRTMGPYRLATTGEARYAAPDGDYAYIEIEVLEVMGIPADQEGAR